MEDGLGVQISDRRKFGMWLSELLSLGYHDVLCLDLIGWLTHWLEY